MTDWLDEYLDNIGMTETLRARVREAYDFFSTACPENITGAFVTDFVTDEGLREYESLWLFSDSYAMEAKRFVSEDHFDMAVLKSNVVRWVVKIQDYDFQHAGDKSRMHLEVNFQQHVSGSLRASRENCDYLRALFLDRIVPNLVKL